MGVSIRVLLCVLFAAGLSACGAVRWQAEHPGPVEIRRSHNLSAENAPARFLIQPVEAASADDGANELAANQVAAFLEQAGHIRVAPENARPADWRVGVEAIFRIVDDHGTGTPARTYAYGWDGAGPRVVAVHPSDGDRAGREYYRRLTVNIVENGQTLYHGSAETTGVSPDAVVDLPRLARALLEPFPGSDGVFIAAGTGGKR